MKALFLALGLALLGAAQAASLEQPAALGLEKAIHETLAQPRFAWRSKRAYQREMSHSVPVQVLKSMVGALDDWAQALGKFSLKGIQGLKDWLERLFRGWSGPKVSTPEPLAGQGSTALVMGWALLGTAAVLTGLLLYRRTRLLKPVPAQPNDALFVSVDLNAAELSGEELPEDAWLQLARQHAESGEHRLAMRAYFLAALNALGRSGWLRLAPSRTVGDYCRQLERRSASGDLRACFGAFSALFEQGWYGTLPVGGEESSRAQRCQEDLRGLAR